MRGDNGSAMYHIASHVFLSDLSNGSTTLLHTDIRLAFSYAIDFLAGKNGPI